MKERIYLQDVRDEAFEEGAEAERRKTVEDMLRRGKTVGEIVEFCGYSEDYVKQVEESMLERV